MKRLRAVVASLIAATTACRPVAASADATTTAVYPIELHDTVCGGPLQRDGSGEASFRLHDELYPNVWRTAEITFHATWTCSDPLTGPWISGESGGLERYPTDGVLDADGHLHSVTVPTGDVTVPPGRESGIDRPRDRTERSYLPRRPR